MRLPREQEQRHSVRPEMSCIIFLSFSQCAVRHLRRTAICLPFFSGQVRLTSLIHLWMLVALSGQSQLAAV